MTGRWRGSPTPSRTGPAARGSGSRSATSTIRWARRTLRTSGIVIVVSDGWDRGDPALVAAETARLRRNCHRLVWLNPLASAPGYQPLAAGMKAAYPFIDDFLAAGTLASLERLGEVLSGSSRSTVRRGSAVTHAATVAPSLGLSAPDAAPPRSLDTRPVDAGTGATADLTADGRTADARTTNRRTRCRSCWTRWTAGAPRGPGSAAPWSCGRSAARRGRRARCCS